VDRSRRRGPPGDPSVAYIEARDLGARCPDVERHSTISRPASSQRRSSEIWNVPPLRLGSSGNPHNELVGSGTGWLIRWSYSRALRHGDLALAEAVCSPALLLAGPVRLGDAETPCSSPMGLRVRSIRHDGNRSRYDAHSIMTSAGGLSVGRAPPSVGGREYDHVQQPVPAFAASLIAASGSDPKPSGWQRSRSPTSA